MIAAVALDLSIGKQFDYAIPPQLEGQVVPGARVKVPFGPRLVLGSVVQLKEKSDFPNLKPIAKLLGAHSRIPPKIMQLAQWISEYYCCPLDMSLKAVLPDSVRQEEEGWRERLTVRPVAMEAPLPKLTARQKEILELVKAKGNIHLSDLVREAKTTPATVRKLEEMHLVTIAAEVSERDPYANETILPTSNIQLNDEQQIVYTQIETALNNVSAEGTEPPPCFLLHGVTGSGKTEIYLQVIEHTLKAGKGALVLVPEISLTPQTVERFKARFSSGALNTMVAVLHSHLSAGERHDEWQKISQNRARIAIGARSAIFAPVENLGLIIVDEEHEHSYKQEESPRYHARDVAVIRGRLEKAVVVLGSATPSMESYFNAKTGKYRLVRMPTRVDDKKMPLVRVIDMRMETRKQKGVPIFSNTLKERIQDRLDQKEQVILFLNRRGYASSMQCPKCGFVVGCPNCSISLTYHRQAALLKCHICNHQDPAPKECPSCKNPAIRFAGIGTEKVEEALTKLFPRARIARMDSDALKRKDDFRRILGEFRTGKLDILLGTQMIAKGLHFPNVTLVGIIYADLSLHLPDFRAGERTFQLLTQVAGRAGRGDVEGEVIVQAFTPFHPAIQFARRHDFEGFYDQEIEFRDQLKYPPISRAAMLTIKGKNEDKVRMSADYVAKEVIADTADLHDLILAGPAPSPLLKAESFFRYQMMLRTRSMKKLSAILANLQRRIRLPDETLLIVDIDPVNLV